MEVSDGTVTNYVYDVDGTRRNKTVGGVAHYYIWEDGRPLKEYVAGKTSIYNAADTMYFFYDQNGAPYALMYNNTTYYYILNVQGDVIRLVDSMGSTVASYVYDPYGNMVSATGAMAQKNPLRYRGYYYDQETGFYYLNARYYDPKIGRFLNADAQMAGIDGNPLEYNLFAYCMNNPVNMCDPDGNWPKKIKKVIKKITENVIRPVSKSLEKKLSQIDLTYSKGINVSGTPSAWIFNGQVGITVDTKGNVAIQSAVGGGVTAGTPSISLTSYTAISNAPSIDNLEGMGYQLGGSLLYGVVAGAGDINIMQDDSANKWYYGLTASGGIGAGTPGGEFHVEWGKTTTWDSIKFNIFDITETFCDKVMEW